MNENPAKMTRAELERAYISAVRTIAAYKEQIEIMKATAEISDNVIRLQEDLLKMYGETQRPTRLHIVKQ